MHLEVTGVVEMTQPLEARSSSSTEIQCWHKDELYLYILLGGQLGSISQQRKCPGLPSHPGYC